jgi:hypothetical protein
MRIVKSAVAFLIAAALAACGESFTAPTTSGAAGPSVSASTQASGTAGADLELVGASIAEVNDALADRGAGVRLAKLEWMGLPVATDAQHQPTQVVFADDRQLRLGSRWVPGDPRRDGREVLNYVVDRTFAAATGVDGGATVALNSEPEIDASFGTWNAAACSSIQAVKQADGGALPSAVLAGGDTGGIDVGTVGFLPGALFDLFLEPGASDATLGVTFSFVFGSMQNGEFVPSDLDGNGLNDSAFKEVWYNDAFDWTDTGDDAAGIDIQTVALHENGHVFDLGHFGKIHATFNHGQGNDRPGTLHVSPRAVMNAINLGTQRELISTDNGAFCGNFGAWPNH